LERADGVGVDLPGVHREVVGPVEAVAADGTNLTISAYTETVDAANLHRRDGNVGPVILAGGEEAYALYGGVFSATTLPYRQPVYVTTSGHTANAFQAQFGHYTCPFVSMHDARTDAMHTVFFGGEGQFYVNETTGLIAQDNLVPFIDDIATLSRASDGTVTETVMPLRMPGLYGTNAQFFQDPALPAWPNGVVRLEDITARTRVGYIHGGIVSTTTNPGYTAGPTEASRKVFAVYVTPDPLAAEGGPTVGPLALGAPTPNPVADRAALTLALARPQTVRVEAFDAVGRRVALLHDGPLAAGAHALTLDAAALAPGLYVVRATGAEGVAAQRVTVARP
ncbi:MAG TPA: hypothetical protein VK610_09370, partial [Rhodothermales bacterium]|nr:hypothetical protein [Rhodothermales bacterium]